MSDENFNFLTTIQENKFPTAMMWNRVEGRPRASVNFDRALRAEVRDALWMLTKQWQMGEFEGDDAGSPVLAKVRMDTIPITRYKAASNSPQPFPDSVPLEAMVEQKPLPLNTFDGQAPMSLDLRVMAGRRWKKILMENKLLVPIWLNSLEYFPILLPDPEKKSDAQICAHPETWQQYAAVAGRIADGLKLYSFLKNDGDLNLLTGGTEGINLDLAIKEFMGWFEQLFLQPGISQGNAWIPSRMEYQFQCSARDGNDEKILTAKEYYHGHLDWYNCNFDRSGNSLDDAETHYSGKEKKEIIRTLLPVPVMFDGMPNTRWWAFEDNRINFNFIKPGTHELSKMLFMEFGLVYANDWFLLPFDISTGTITSVRGISVSNVFGEHFWIEPAGRGADSDWDRWNMFAVKTEGMSAASSDTSLVLLPTVPQIQESKPMEKIFLIRDEMANMVWGIETVIPLAHGETSSGSVAASQLRNYMQGLVYKKKVNLPDPVENDDDTRAKIRYEIMNEVPENWIPFIPVHVEGSSRAIKLQRAAMPRILKGDQDKPEKVKPRTSLLAEGLVTNQPYYIFEEEVPRSGIEVCQSYQRTRWKNGQVIVWYGAHKTTGRGEGRSGLSFDLIKS